MVYAGILTSIDRLSQRSGPDLINPVKICHIGYSAVRAIAFVTMLAALAGCASTPTLETASVADASECVVLLHGLNRNSRAMRPLAEALHASGYSVANVDYPSRAGPVEELVGLSVGPGVDQCRREGAEIIHFVTHSIGGILVRFAVQESGISGLGRVVMLAPPNQGSEVVDRTGHWPGAVLVGGQAGLQLGTRGERSIPARLGPVNFELGVIAGTRTQNPFMSAMLPNPDDGKVSVASTKVQGMRDFLLVPHNHHTIMTADEVIENTTAFLKTGRFADSALR